VALPGRFSLRSIAFGAALVAAVAVAYWGTLDGEFIWDDDLHVTANPTIVGPLGLKEIWTSARANYFPLVLTNFWIVRHLAGLDPWPYHAVTLACHALAALLLWRVLRRLMGRDSAPRSEAEAGALLGAALWALHPVQVESVAWISELKNTQSAVFFLWAIWFWLRWLDKGRRLPAADSAGPAAGTRSEYALALLCAALAILSKPSTVMLPIALGLCAWWQRGRI
jgi:protein O-mannosyl-transferase